MTANSSAWSRKRSREDVTIGKKIGEKDLRGAVTTESTVTVKQNNISMAANRTIVTDKPHVSIQSFVAHLSPNHLQAVAEHPNTLVAFARILVRGLTDSTDTTKIASQIQQAAQDRLLARISTVHENRHEDNSSDNTCEKKSGIVVCNSLDQGLSPIDTKSTVRSIANEITNVDTSNEGLSTIHANHERPSDMLGQTSSATTSTKNAFVSVFDEEEEQKRYKLFYKELRAAKAANHNGAN